MLLACRDGDETGNRRGWISAKFLALHYGGGTDPGGLLPRPSETTKEFAAVAWIHRPAGARSGSPAAYGAWRRYAALNAADLLASLLRNPGFPWPS